MRYASINKNDIANGDGICVSFWTQGCPNHLHCKGCHNSSIWDFNGGREFSPTTLEEIISAISANGIKRNFSVLGGEPLCEENLFLTTLVITEVRKKYPDIQICVWTGYTYEQLDKSNPHIKMILESADYLIAGPYIQEQRDITLKWRGSRNQEIIDLKQKI